MHATRERTQKKNDQSLRPGDNVRQEAEQAWQLGGQSDDLSIKLVRRKGNYPATRPTRLAMQK
jgi:hypothetical protein